MNLNSNKLIFVLISTLLLMTTFAVSSEKNITYMQILQKPNDLDLNLKYAQQQGKMGNYKQTISTLERLTMIYPENMQPNLCSNINKKIKCENGILYEPRALVNGSIVCHLGEVHLGFKAKGQIVNKIQILD